MLILGSIGGAGTGARTMEEMLQHAAAEIQAVWELYAQGICREFYTRANDPGRVVLLFESASVEAAKEALATLPFAQLHLIDDVAPPFQPRGIEIRGHADAFPDGGRSISPDFSPALIRLTPERIISWNLAAGDPAQTHLARDV